MKIIDIIDIDVKYIYQCKILNVANLLSLLLLFVCYLYLILQLNTRHLYDTKR